MPPKDTTPEQHRQRLEEKHRQAQVTKTRGQRAQVAARTQRTQAQKDRMNHFVRDTDGKARLKEGVQSKGVGKEKVLTPGFDAETKGPERMDRLKDRQNREQQRMLRAQARAQRAAKEKGKARDDFNRNGSEGYGLF